jgi:hypothetical protein
VLRLQRIDALIRAQHAYLRPDDECFFLREYTARAGFAHGETNNLILNLKKSVDRRGKPEWAYKEQAIERAGQELRHAWDAVLRGNLDRFTIVPMPPSLARSNPLYDERMRHIVDVMTRGLASDVRELVVQTVDLPPAHRAGATQRRPRPDEIYAAYAVDESVAAPPPQNILVIDDVLTAGAHFTAIQRRLRDRFPAVGKILGGFYARRAVGVREESK